jgi:hypothetical protein
VNARIVRPNFKKSSGAVRLVRAQPAQVIYLQNRLTQEAPAWDPEAVKAELAAVEAELKSRAAAKAPPKRRHQEPERSSRKDIAAVWAEEVRRGTNCRVLKP